MAPRKPDIELLFGVLGGGSLSGDSGAKIAQDLQSILKDLEKKNILQTRVEITSAIIRSQNIKAISDRLRLQLETAINARPINLTNFNFSNISGGIAQDIADAIKKAMQQSGATNINYNSLLQQVINNKRSGGLHYGDSNANSELDKAKKTLKQITKLSDDSINAIMHGLQEMSIEIDKVTTKFDDATGEVSVAVRGFNDKGDLVTAVKKYSTEGEKVIDVSKTIVQSFKTSKDAAKEFKHEVDLAFSDLKSIQDEIAKKELKLVNLDPEKDRELINSINSELSVLKKDANDIHAIFGNFFSQRQSNTLAKQFEDATQELVNLEAHLKDLEINDKTLKYFNIMLMLLRQSQDVQIEILSSDDKDKIEKLRKNLEAIQKEYSRLEAETNGKLSGDQLLRLNNTIEAVNKNVLKFESSIEKKSNIKQINSDFEKMLYLVKKIEGIQIDFLATEDVDKQEELLEILESLENEYYQLETKTSGKLSDSQSLKLGDAIENAEKKVSRFKVALEEGVNAQGVKELKDSIDDLTEKQKEIGQLRIEIEKLKKVGGKSKQIDELTKQLEHAEDEYDELIDNLFQNLDKKPIDISLVESSKIDKEINKAAAKVRLIKASIEDEMVDAAKKITNSFKSKDYALSLTKLAADASLLNDEYPDLNKNLIIAKTAYEDMQKIIDNNDDSAESTKKLVDVYELFAKAIKTASNELGIAKKLESDRLFHAKRAATAKKDAAKTEEKAAKDREKLASKERSDLQKILRLYDQVVKYKRNNTKIEGTSFGNRLDSIITTLEQVKNGALDISKVDISDLTKQFTHLKGGVDAAGLSGKSLLTIIKEGYAKYGGWSFITKTMSAAWRSVQKMITAVKDIDTAMTELKKVTNETAQVYDSFLSTSTIRARQLGATVADTVSSTADFARLGYSLEYASSLADAAIIYKNVGDGIEDIGDASESIISTIKAFEKFGVTAENAMLVVDKFNEIGNKFAISSKGIGDALLNSAAALAAAGNDLDKSIAMITAANEVIQEPEHVGTTLKTVSMFLRAAKTEAEEAGESTEGMANSVSELRSELLALTGGKVDIQIDTNSFKDTYTILRELSGEWENLTDITRANILEMVGGKRNANVVAALIENFATAEEVLQKSADAAGSATAENEKFLDSINGRIAQFKASFETLAQTVIESDLVKWVVDAGTSILDILTKVVDTLETLPTIVGAASVALSSFNVKSPLSFIDIQTGDFSTNFGLTTQLTKDSVAIKRYAKAMSILSKNSKAAKKAYESMIDPTSSLAKQFLEGKNAADLANVSILKIKAGLIQYKVAAVAAKAATMFLNAAFSVLVSAAINVLIKKLHETRDLAQAMLDDSEKYRSAADSINEYISEIDSLKDSLDSGNLSQAEAYDARIRLLQIQNDVISTYGKEAASIDLLNMSAVEATKSLNNLNASLAKEYLAEHSTAISKAIKELEAVKNYFDTGALLRITKNSPIDPEFLGEITSIVEKYESASLRYTNPGKDGKSYVYLDVNANAFDAKETLVNLAADFADLQDRYSIRGIDISKFFYGWETPAQKFEKALADVNKVLEKDNLGAVYEEAIPQKIATNNKYLTQMESIVDLQKRYNDALATTYGSEVEQDIAIGRILADYEAIKNIISADNFFNKDDYGVKQYFENLLSPFEAEGIKRKAQAILEDTFNTYLKEYKEAGNAENAGDYDVHDGIVQTKALIDAREKFIETARLAGLTEEQISLALKDSKLAMDNLSGSIKGAETNIFTLNEALSSLSTMQGEVDKLSEALGEFYENKKISAETAAGLVETFGTLEGFDDFIATITDSSSSFSDVQNALNVLGAQYVENEGILSKLNEENKDATAHFLKQIGVVNADQVVMVHLANNQVEAAIASGELTDKTWESIEAFLTKAGVSAAVIDGLEKLRTAEYEAMLESIEFTEATSKEIDKLIELAAIAGVSADKITKLNAAKRLALLAEKGLLPDEADYEDLMSQLQNGASTDTDYTVKVELDVDLPKDIKDKAKDAFEKLQKEFSKIIANFEHNIFLGEKNGADYTAIIAIYKEMQEAVHAQAEKYRAMGLAENSEYIQELQKQWWDYHDKIQQLHKEAFDNYLDDSKFSIEKMANDNADAQDIISAWQEVLSGINNEIEYYQSLVKDSPADFGIKSETLSKLESVKESLLEINKIYGGNVDLTNRKRVDVTDDNIGTVHGWGGMDDTVVGDYMTVASQTFRTGKTAVVVTPILPNGELLNQQELESYMDSLFDNTIDGNFASNDSLGIVMGVFGDRGTWEENLTLADEFAIKVHELHEQYEVLSADVAKFDSSVENATFNDEIADRIQELVKETWAAKEEIENAIQAVVDKANESLDGFQDAYSTITDAAKEYASTGYLSADSLQSLLDLGPKYLSFLEDENGQLVLNEEALQNVIAAKTEEMAVETAMAFAKRVLIAAENDDIKALEELTQVNISATNSTWDMAYATLGLAKAIGTAKGHSSAYYDDAIREVRNIQALAKTTVSSIQEYYKTLNEGYVSQADGLQTILEMTQEMIQWENDQKIETLEKEKELFGDIVDAQRESLELAKEQDDHNKSVAEKLEKIARLQDNIDMLKLDDSREASAQRSQLEQELNELQKELADEQADYAYELQVDTLEKQQQAFEDSKDEEIEALESTLDSAEELYQAAIKRIDAGWDDLYKDLLSWNYEYGSTLEKDLVTAWDAATAAVQRYGSFVEALEGVQSYTNLGSGYTDGSGVSSGVAMTDQMTDIYNKMKQNSFDWFLAGDKSKQADLSSENVGLAKDWEALTGQALTPKDFSWYMSDGSLFYSLDKNDVAKAVVSEMESNAAKWKIADQQGDSAKKNILSAKNSQMAADLAYYLNRKIENIGGTWYIDGRPLFDEFDRYHTGGIVGGKGTLKQNEVMAVLEEGEIILDEGKEKVFYRFVDFAQMMSEKLGKAFDNTSFKNAFSGQNRMPALVGNAIPETTNNMNFNPIVNVNIQHSGSLDDGDAKRFGSIAANSVLSELTDAFSRRGISNMGSAFLK